jgi:hypothetical protein
LGTSQEIREIVAENLRELLPQYLGETFGVPKNAGMENQPTTPRPLSRRPSGPPPLPKRDNNLFLEEGTTGNLRSAAEFTFKVPFQGRKDRADGSPLLSRPDAPAIEMGRSNSRVSFPSQGLTQKLSRKTSSLTAYSETSRNPDRPSAPQQSAGHHGLLGHPFLQGNQISRKVEPPSTTFEGSSPTLQVAASRSPKQSPVNSQREDDPSGTDRTGVTDHTIVGPGEEVPSRQQSRLIQRTGSTKSLRGNNRNRDGESLLIWRERWFRFSPNRTSIVRKFHISRELDALPEGDATIHG